MYLYAAGGLVVDTGFARAGNAAGQWIREQRPAALLLTHHHEDHSGNMARVARMGIPILAHPLAIERTSRGFPVPYYRRRVWGLPALAAAQPVPERLDAGNVIHVPGHSPDMVVLHDASRGRLFTADLYIATRLPYLRDDEDAPAIIESLRRVLRLEFDTVFCAHRGVLRDGRQRLQQKLAWLEDLRGQVLRLAAAGAGEREIANRVLGREGFIYYMSFGQFARRHYVRSFLHSKM